MSKVTASRRVTTAYRSFGGVVFFIGIGLTFFGACFLYLDPDYGWHLKAGDYIRSHGVPAHDIFTYTAQSFPWIDHEWLNDVIVSWLYGVGGYLAVALVYAAVWTAALCGASRKFNWPLLGIAAAAILPYAGIRPIAWTVLFLVVLERIIESSGRTLLLSSPLLFLFWANLHGGFLVGLAVLGAESLLKRRRDLLLIGLICAAVSLINPYGLRLYVELFRTLSDPSLHYRILEWMPLYFRWPTILYICYAAAVFLYLEQSRLRSAASVPGALFLAALSSTRNTPLFVVGSIRKLESYVKAVRTRMPSNLRSGQRFVLALLVFTPLLLSLYAIISYFVPVTSQNSGYPLEQAAYLKAHPCSGRLFNSYNFGGYLIWQLPSEPVYIDGRMPSWRRGGIDYFADYERIAVDTRFRKAQFTKFGIRCVLLDTSQPNSGSVLANFVSKTRKNPSLRFARSLRSEGWRAVSTSAGSVLLEKP